MVTAAARSVVVAVVFAGILAAGLPADTRVVWQETETERVKIKYDGDREVGRWTFPKKGTEPSADTAPLPPPATRAVAPLKPVPEMIPQALADEVLQYMKTFLAQPKKNRVDLIIALAREGRTFWSKGDGGRAEAYLAASAGMAPAIYHANTPTTARYVLSAAFAIESQSRLNNALQAYDMAIGILDKHKSNLNYLEELQQAHLGRARVLRRLGRTAQAMESELVANGFERTYGLSKARRCKQCECILDERIPPRNGVCYNCLSTTWHDITGKPMWRFSTYPQLIRP